MGKYQSGQMGQTVNLLAYAFGGSNPSLPTTKKRNRASFFISTPQNSPYLGTADISGWRGRNQEYSVIFAPWNI